MKNITRVLALLLALILVLGLVVTGFAEGVGETETGTITITNTKKDQTYTIYKVLTLESYDTGKQAYSYKPASEQWKTFLTTGDGKDYVTITAENNADNVEAGYVTWKAVADETEITKAARVAEFAKKALAYAKQENITSNGTSTANADNATVEFNSLSLGYYLVDSSLGTLCSLNTTKPNVEIAEKNDVPTNKKEVKEGNNWVTSNDANIGDTVEFQSTITAKLGADSYVFHDTMSEGLTFNSTSVTVTKGGTEVAAEGNYTLKTTTTEITDGCTFEIVFNQTFCDTLNKDDTIVITYSATLNEKAKIGTDENTNVSKLSYGDNNTTNPSQTTTKTWEVKVFKFHKKSETVNTPLSGATFKLSKDEQGTTLISLVKVENTTDITYRVAKADATGATTAITTTETGKFTIQGLDSGIYYLTETKAPGGYNKLKAAVKITIANDGTVKVDDKDVTNNEVLVENKTGAEMPSTGGIGTTVFYVVGGILAVGAAVLLVTKKRMERG